MGIVAFESAGTVARGPVPLRRGRSVQRLHCRIVLESFKNSIFFFFFFMGLRSLNETARCNGGRGKKRRFKNKF